MGRVGGSEGGGWGGGGGRGGGGGGLGEEGSKEDIRGSSILLLKHKVRFSLLKSGLLTDTTRCNILDPRGAHFPERFRNTSPVSKLR